MLDKVIEGTSKRGITFTTYTRQADSSVIQHQIAEAALDIDSAYLHLMNAAELVHVSPLPGQHLVRRAVDTPASMGGASGFADANPLQRMRRDVNIATRNALLATDPALEIYGRALLGVEGNISPLV